MLLMIRRFVYACCYIMAIMVLIIIWSFVLMIIDDNILPPFDRLISFVMLHNFPFADLADRDLAGSLLLLEKHLNASRNLANIAWNFIIGSAFALFIGYLFLIYKEEQRQLHENRLLQLKNQEISFRNEFIRYISATIGHEFKNNLARIKRRFVLLKGLPPWITESIHGNFDKLFSDIEIFKKIADESEAGLIHFEKTNLVTLLNEVTFNYKELATISFCNNDQAMFVFTAIPLLKTVFENIIDNAVKYKKDEQSLAHIVISLSLDSDDNRRYIVLSFKDEGIGMDEQTAEQCFYKTSNSKDGWGHGMYYSKYVIGLHAGKIKVGKENTELGRGTEIIIHLPLIVETENV